MGGMSLGAGLLHRSVSLRHHPLKVYGFIELAIGAFGVIVPLVLPLVTRGYVSLAPQGISDLMLRGMIGLLILSPPTILMGATLPAIARWMENTPNGFSRLGLFYGGNIVGAVLGSVVAGMYLLREFDVYVASAAAVSINVLVAMIGLGLARTAQYRAAEPSPERESEASGQIPTVYVVAALSGFTALGAQVIWTRLLSIMLGATVYTFSLILALFLGGLGIGSVTGAVFCRRCQRPLFALAICQALLIPAIAIAGIAIVQESSYLNLASDSSSWVAQRFNDGLRCAIVILPATILWGASFPLAIASIGFNRLDPAKAVGRLYASNTIGAIAAVILVSAIFIPTFGTRISQQILIVVAALSTAILLASAVATQLRPATMKRVGSTAAIALVAFSAVRFVPELDGGLISYGRETDRWSEPHDYLHVEEGMTASVAVTQLKNAGYRSFHIGGKVVASTFPQDMRLQRLLGHVPALLHRRPKSVLVIGFGAGVTAGTFVLHDEIERIVIVEIEPVVVSAAAQYFGKENYDVFNDPRTEVIYDDGRHFLSTTTESFDIITADPVHPWVKGAAALYTEEFFELCKTRLNDGGLITQWVPLYETNEAAVKSEIGTFFDVFPEGGIWNSRIDGKGYDVFTMSSTQPMSIDAQQIREKLAENDQLRRSLAEVDVRSALDVLKSFAGQRQHVADWLEDYEPNLDRNLRLEYLAGLSLDSRNEYDIYAAMTAGVDFPENVFTLNAVEEAELRDWFASTYGEH